MRYFQLTTLLNELKPAVIMEIGTWSGERARQMMLAGDGMVYFGFDLFEDGSPEDDKRELNVKRHYTAAEVSAGLRGFPHKLYRGYTRETLPVFMEDYGPGKVDFAFIDGGHSVDTIQTDWNWTERFIRPGGVVVFDDYYTNCSDADLDSFGCNRVVENIGLEGVDYEILRQTDKVANGWNVQMVRVNV